MTRRLFDRLPLLPPGPSWDRPYPQRAPIVDAPDWPGWLAVANLGLLIAAGTAARVLT